MTPEQWQLVRSVFDAALARAPAQRVAVVDAACRDDPRIDAALRGEILGLLAAADADAATGLGAAAPDLLARLGEEAQRGERDRWIGARVGPWALVRAIGQGGMGAVYLGERVDGDFRQRAAIKLVRASWDAGELQRRFRSERRILASLSHPHIARLLDGGETTDGLPYLAMEFVDGAPLGRHCDEHRLTIRERLQLFLSVCEAVAHAHRNLVVHRDLKPSNILVDADGEVKLLDFGIARLLEADAHATGSALRLFTPEYAAPEQVRGDAVTTSVDVHALGLLLFELLAGSRPYGQAASTPAAYERAILFEEPQRPSLAARGADAAVAHARRLAPGELAAALRGDLDAIVLKALRKDPVQRYGSIEAFADDVRRHLQHQPVDAHRGGWRYRAGRLLHRHRVVASMAALATAALLLGSGVALWQARVAREQQRVAQGEADKARAVTQFLTNVFKAANPDNNDGANPRATELLARALADIDAQTDIAPGTRASLLLAMGNAYLSIGDNPRGLDITGRALQAAATSGDDNLRFEATLDHARALDVNGHTSDSLAELQALPREEAAGAPIDERLRRRFDYVVATMLENLDRPGEALPYVQRAYEQARRAHGLGSAEVGHVLEVYVSVLDSLHRDDEAVAVSRANFEASKASADMPLARKVNFASSYGYALINAKRSAEAEHAYREAVALEEKLYGADNPSIDVSLNNLGVAVRNLGRYEEAERIGERVLALRRSHLPPDSPAIARALCALGETYRRGGQAGKGAALLEEGLGIFERLDQDGRSSALNARINLSLALEDAGRYDDALAEVARVLPHTKLRGSTYSGAAGAPVLLLHARLLARATPALADCGAARAVLAVADTDSAPADEARVLAADCEARADPMQARSRLQALVKPDEEGRLTPFAAERLAELRRTLR